MKKCSCGCDMDIVHQCQACSFNDGKKQGALDELLKCRLMFNRFTIDDFIQWMNNEKKELEGVEKR